jgi:hypothetical protein
MSQSNQPIETQDPTVPAGEEAVARPRAAYQRLLPEILAVPDESLLVINLDIPAIVSTGLGVLPEVRVFDADIRKMHDFDLSAYEKLEDYALALHHANVLYLAASTPPEALKDLIDRATTARELLLTDIASFIAHGHIAPRRPGELDRSLGHRGIAVDVGRLTEIVREAWPKLQGKTSLTFPKLVEFETLSAQLVDALGLKEQGEALVVEVAARRQRIFTLFVRAYDEVRRGVSFLRWRKGDVDDIIPSLYSGRAGRRRSEPDPVPGSPAAPGIPGTPTAPGVPGTSAVPVTPQQPGAAMATGLPAPAVPIGHPGSDPFGP